MLGKYLGILNILMQQPQKNQQTLILHLLHFSQYTSPEMFLPFLSATTVPPFSILA